MGTMTISLPDELKARLDKTDWVNWSSVARRAFAETLEDVKELELKRRVQKISEIAEDDKREVKESLAREVVASVEQTAAELRSGKRKPMSLKEIDELMGLEQ